MGKIIGIDLGTTNSCVAVMENGEPVVIQNSEGGRTTPSIVGFTSKGDRIVGAPAKNQMVTNPKNTVYSVKRLIGHRFGELTGEATKLPYKVVDNGADCRVEVEEAGSKKQYSPQEISAFILQKMKKTAEDYLGQEVTEAVITVPAYFNDAQRQATKDAGKIAGLDVKRIINEPTAASLAFGFKQDQDQEKTIAVYDLGGGTFDISILELGDGVFEVKSTNGDTHLGGDDWDRAISNWLIDEFKKDTGIDLSADPMAMQRLREAAENAKISLSNQTTTDINLPFITADATGPKHLQKSLSRAQFEQMTDDLFERTKEPCRKALADAGITADKIDEVLLVGGSSRMPQVQEALKNAFGDKLNKSSNYDEAVALGAAIQAKAIVNPEESDTLLLDVTPITLGIEVNGNMMGKLIEANTTIPAKKSQVFTTAVDNQPAVSIVVLQGERPMSKDNKQIGMFNLDGIAPAPRGIPQIEVTFDIDANGTLTVSAKDLGTQKEQHITISDSNALSQEEIDRIKKEAEEHKAEDAQKKAEFEKKNQAEGYVYSVEHSLTDENLKDKFTDDEKKQLEDLVAAAKKAIDEKNDTELFAKKDELEKVYGPIITRIYQENAPKDANGNPQVDPNMFNNMFGGQGGNGQNPFGGNPFQAGAPFTETK